MLARIPLAFTFGFDPRAVDEQVQWTFGPTIRQAYVQSLLASAKVLKSGAAQSNPTKRSKLWTNPVV